MATQDQIAAIVSAHYQKDNDKFNAGVQQIIAHETSKGSSFGDHLKRIMDSTWAKRNGPRTVKLDKNGFIVSSLAPSVNKSALVIEHDLNLRIEQILSEHRSRDKLSEHGLRNRRKILLIGPPGTGKTMTAHILAHELSLQLHIVLLDKIMGSYLGDTARNLRTVFDTIADSDGVFLLDEIDSIAGSRSRKDDIAEMRRVLNSLLQLIEQDDSDAVIVAACNNPKLLDAALFRRFDDTLWYEKPSVDTAGKLILQTLGAFFPLPEIPPEITAESGGLSHAEIVQACCDSMKLAVLSDRYSINLSELCSALDTRKTIYKGDLNELNT